ncbi:CARDB domain-containing protein [Halovivax gelatinilyticus]|uniref:CARDB domain-containing protein n=1 Tax=Halovivax gelatinilyticus TaxID=2961597 RepID=UPI0020CA6E4B|nr:CARDB domain-containing protein [Halovivax gelatinilyticus]
MQLRLLVIATVLALLLVVPTAAISVSDTDSPGGVEFSATSEYATIEDGELTLDFDRLNQQATTETHDVFEITATDDDADEIWIDHDLQGVRFYAHENPSNSLSRTSPLRLDPGESATVGVSVDTSRAQPGSETFSIVVGTEDDDDEDEDEALPDAGPLNVSNASVDATTVTAGEPVSVAATVSNPGAEPATGTLPLAIDGIVVADRELTLEPGENRTVSFIWTPDATGVYDVHVADAPAGSVAVSDAAATGFGSVELASPLTAAVAPPATLGLVVAASVVRRRRI